MIGGWSRRSVLAASAALLVMRPARADSPRIAVTELDLAEALLTLGIPPLAMTEASRYRALFSAPALPASCIELGAAWEPNLELLRELAPQAILASPDRALLLPVLRQVAPVTVIHPQEDGDRHRRGLGLIEALAAQLSREAQARRAVGLIQDRIAAARESLARRRWPPIFLAALVEGGTHLEFYGRGCLLDDALAACGLVNAWTHPMPSYGWVVAGIENLAAAPDAILVLLDFGARTPRAIRDFLASDLWRSLPPQREGRVVMVPAASVWGGAPTAAAFATRLAEGLERLVRHG